MPSKFTSRPSPKRGTVAELIAGNNAAAVNHVRHKLGETFCADTEDECFSHRFALTKDGMFGSDGEFSRFQPTDPVFFKIGPTSNATRTHIDRITAIVEDPANEKERAAFNSFADELRDDLNGSISDGEVIEMLAQHLITKPVFDALFKDYSFAQHNPMSLAMQGVLDVLQEHRLDKETDTLQRFYDSVKMRAEGIESSAGKQKLIVELYDKFFTNAFPRLRDKLGIVYTPVQVVDFIIHSVAHILETEFGQTLGSKGGVGGSDTRGAGWP